MSTRLILLTSLLGLILSSHTTSAHASEFGLSDYLRKFTSVFKLYSSNSPTDAPSASQSDSASVLTTRDAFVARYSSPYSPSDAGDKTDKSNKSKKSQKSEKSTKDTDDSSSGIPQQLQAAIDALQAQIDALEGTGSGGGVDHSADIDLLQAQLDNLSERFEVLENRPTPPATSPQPPGLGDWQVVDSSPEPKPFGSFITFLKDEEVHVLFEFEHNGASHRTVVELINGVTFQTTIGNAIFYTDGNCTSQPYMKVYDENYRSMFTTTPAGLLSDRRNDAQFAELYVATDTTVQRLSVMSRRGPSFDPPGQCNSVDFNENAVPAELVMDLYDVYTPPFKVVPRPS